MTAITMLLSIFLISTQIQCSPVKPQRTIEKLNYELDKSEIIHEISIKFSSDSMGEKKVKLGEKVELLCEAAGSPPPMFYWTFDGKKINDNSETNIYEKLHNIGKVTIQNAVTVSRIVIPCARKEHAGRYKCIANNGHQKMEKVANIIIENTEHSEKCESQDVEAPKIVQWSNARFENEGNSAQLTCRTDSPSATVAWYNEDRKLLNNEPGFEVFANGDMMIKNSKWEHMGVYTCVASNEFGEDRAEIFFYPTLPE